MNKFRIKRTRILLILLLGTVAITAFSLQPKTYICVDDVICLADYVKVIDKNENPVTGLVRATRKDGKVLYEGMYKNGERDGVHKSYSFFGKLMSEGSYENGNAVGVHKTYYENGQLKAEGSFENGKENGIYKEYYNNGRLEKEMNMKDGKIDGFLKTYYPYGQLAGHRIYEDGKLKIEKSYYDNGQLKLDVKYEAKYEGDYDRVEKVYDERGHLLEKKIIKNGRLY